MALKGNTDMEEHPVLPRSRIPARRPGSNEDPAMVGQGSFGIVFKVLLGSGIYAARKVFEKISNGESNTRACHTEFALLKRTRDENASNVVQLLPAHSSARISGGTVEPEAPCLNPAGELSFEMEWATLGNLREFIENNPRIQVNEGLVAWVGRQAFSGLAWLHRRHILHGDVKPENLLCWGGKDAPYIKLGDLGSAVHLDRNGVDSAGKIRYSVTTEPYSAPEMMLTGIDPEIHVTQRADVYSMGSVMIEMAGTQHPTFPAPHAASHLSHKDKMRYLYDRRPHQLSVFNGRFEVSDSMQELFDVATAWEVKQRLDANTLRFHPAFDAVRDGYKLQYWVEESKLLTATERADKLDIVLKVSQREQSSCASSACSFPTCISPTLSTTLLYTGLPMTTIVIPNTHSTMNAMSDGQLATDEESDKAVSDLLQLDNQDEGQGAVTQDGQGEVGQGQEPVGHTQSAGTCPSPHSSAASALSTQQPTSSPLYPQHAKVDYESGDEENIVQPPAPKVNLYAFLDDFLPHFSR